ncbi:MAG: SPOR domain-containing protein [Vicingus serpentipes]|nr:SPOR domain-containing protein [Vicingus serpentipes]
MKIDQYISELLFQYDCVIVPELGGFVGNYKPASIQSIQNTFNPPSKQISFNRHLNSNDGLLANHIAQKENVSYDRACEEINAFTLAIQQRLNAKESVLMEEVGTLFLDTENRIQFEPKLSTNYLLASYGLTSFQKSPIKRATLEDKITKEFKDRTTPLKVVKEGNTSTKKWMLTAAITIPFIFFSIWIPSKYNLGGDINYAHLNPFKPTPASVYSERTAVPVFEEVDENDIQSQLLSSSEDAYFVKVAFAKNGTPVTIKLKEQPTIEAVSTFVATNKKELQYHLVSGCFSKKSNAKQMVKSLKEEGFNAWIVGKRKGLWTVSCNSFATRREAVDALADARFSNVKVWVLNY